MLREKDFLPGGCDAALKSIQRKRLVREFNQHQIEAESETILGSGASGSHHAHDPESTDGADSQTKNRFLFRI